MQLENGIFFLRNLKDGKVPFQIFANSGELEFAPRAFTCRRKAELEICHTRLAPVNFPQGSRGILRNLEFFQQPGEFLQAKVDFFASKGLVPNRDNFDRFATFTRGEALAFILRLRFEGRDFQEFAGDCFEDVKQNSEFAGEICWAKQQGIVRGIAGRFLPSTSVNLWGILKFLFLIFENSDRSFDENALGLGLFAQMQEIHAAFPILAKGLFEGIFENLERNTLWANRNVPWGEGLQIIDNFWNFHFGTVLKDHSVGSGDFSENLIFKRPANALLAWQETGKEFSNESPASTKVLRENGDSEVFLLRNGNLAERIFATEREIAAVQLSFDRQRLQGQMQIEFASDEVQTLKAKVSKNQFEFLRGEFELEQSVLAKKEIAARHLLPNPAARPASDDLPRLKFYLSENDLLSIFQHRTANRRFPAFLEMIFPDGQITRRSVLLKTRGNASRGFIKSSFTVESFTDFQENENFPGDEFLQSGDEFKMRSLIDESTQIHEKLFYRAAAKLGILAPEFFSATAQINGIDLGLFQITESVGKKFFKRRGINTEEFFYARNSGAVFDTNLKFYQSDETTAGQFKFKNSPATLLDLIRNLEADNADFLGNIDTENVFNFAALIFVSAASDSLTHNFYVFLDEDSGKWGIFPWDGDATFEKFQPLEWPGLLQFGRAATGSFNNLIRFVFTHTSEEKLREFYGNFRRDFNGKVHLEQWAENHASKLGEFLQFDNALWNGKALERKNKTVDSLAEIEKLREILRNLQQTSDNN